VTTGILAISLSGIMVAFVGAFTLNEDMGMKRRALDAAMARIEAVRMQAIASWGTLVTAPPLPKFEIPGPPTAPTAYNADAEGRLTLTPINPPNQTAYVIAAQVCWRARGGRIMGGDRNLNGVLDAGEPDLNGDGLPDCPVQLVTTVARRT